MKVLCGIHIAFSEIRMAECNNFEFSWLFLKFLWWKKVYLDVEIYFLIRIHKCCQVFWIFLDKLFTYSFLDLDKYSNCL